MRKAYSANRFDLQSKMHQFKVVPVIQAVNSNKGSVLGQELEIDGIGFSYFKDEMTVLAGSQKCDITIIKNNRIMCRV